MMTKTMTDTRFKVGDVVRMNHGLCYDVDFQPGIVVELYPRDPSRNMGILWLILNRHNTFIVTGSWADDELSIYNRAGEEDREDQ